MTAASSHSATGSGTVTPARNAASRIAILLRPVPAHRHAATARRCAAPARARRRAGRRGRSTSSAQFSWIAPPPSRASRSTATAPAPVAAASQPASGPAGILRSRPSRRSPRPSLEQAARHHHPVHLRGAVDQPRLARVAVHPLQGRVLASSPSPPAAGSRCRPPGAARRRPGSWPSRPAPAPGRPVELDTPRASSAAGRSRSAARPRRAAPARSPCPPERWPKARRSRTWGRAISSARRAMPSQRMQWVSRAMPRRVCVTRMPRPSPSSTFSTGISSPSNSSSQWPPCSSGPMIGMRRTMRQPGWSLVEQHRGEAAPRIVGGARQEDEVGCALGAGDEPFVAVHDVAVALRAPRACASSRRGRSRSPAPARSSRSPSGRCRRRSAAASAPSGLGVPSCSSTSMLPSSGAAQLQATGPEARAAELLVDHGHADRRQAQAAPRQRQLRAP